MAHVPDAEFRGVHPYQLRGPAGLAGTCRLTGAPASTRVPADGALCRNCGTRRIDQFCHHCGQTGRIHNTFRSILHDLAHGAFSFEGRIWRTLPLLVLQPGALTRRYIAGERARLVSPLAMFVFTVFLLFATFEALGPGDLSDGISRGATAAETGFDRTMAANAAALARLDAQRITILRRGGNTVQVDAKIAARRNDIAELNRTRDTLAGRRGEQVTGWAWLDRGIARARENPALVLQKVQSSAHQYSWMLIPLSTPLVAMLFVWRRRHSLYDHAIFTTYSISFMSLLVVALEVAAAVGLSGAWIASILFAAVPLHMFAQLRGAYGLSRFSAGWRTLFMAVTAVAVLLLFILAAVAMGLSG